VDFFSKFTKKNLCKEKSSCCKKNIVLSLHQESISVSDVISRPKAIFVPNKSNKIYGNIFFLPKKKKECSYYCSGTLEGIW